ncbi:MAG: hypothetical protein HC880_06500 [Bacteroidia bacterium]|nr:hypothetical protein [Bacteroidia bacterium]
MVALQKITSLKYYLLISQYEHRVELFARSPEDANLWSLRSCESLQESLDLAEMNLKLSLATIYEDVSLENRDDLPRLGILNDQ